MQLRSCLLRYIEHGYAWAGLQMSRPRTIDIWTKIRCFIEREGWNASMSRKLSYWLQYRLWNAIEISITMRFHAFNTVAQHNIWRRTVYQTLIVSSIFPVCNFNEFQSNNPTINMSLFIVILGFYRFQLSPTPFSNWMRHQFYFASVYINANAKKRKCVFSANLRKQLSQKNENK